MKLQTAKWLQGVVERKVFVAMRESPEQRESSIWKVTSRLNRTMREEVESKRGRPKSPKSVNIQSNRFVRK